MFFEYTESKISKSLFLKLFALLAISKDSKVKDEQNELELGSYSNYLGEADLNYVKKIILEDNFLSEIDFIGEKTIASQGIGNIALGMASLISPFSAAALGARKVLKAQEQDKNETKLVDIQASISDYIGPALKVLNTEIKSVCDNAIFVYKEDPTYKQKIINTLIDKGIDRLSITPKLVDDEAYTILDVPDVKKSIIEKVTKEQDLFRTKISNYDKKIILFNLFKYLFEQVSYSEYQIELMKVICEKLELDSEYFDEFYEATMKYVSSYREVSELINE